MGLFDFLKSKDADGNAYRSVKIGQQVWMVENLKTTKYNDGEDIPLEEDNKEWLNLSTPAYCWYNNNQSNKNIYGAMYNWYAINSGKLAPQGWHVPTDEEWTVLENYLISNGYNYHMFGDNVIAKSLAAKKYWKNEANFKGSPGYEISSNNRSGFTALPGGFRNEDGVFMGIDQTAYWWSASEESADSAWFRGLIDTSWGSRRSKDFKISGHSVRCMKD